MSPDLRRVLGIQALALLAALLSVLHEQAHAQPGWSALEQRCWQQHTAERTAVDLRDPMALRFSNLRSGFHVRSPVWVEFSVRGMGVMPAGHARERSGHHHLLIDTPLPRDHREQIPFSDKHKHFGKGQTGTALELAPGEHRLRLLFADHSHRPYFVFSPEILLHVLGPRNGPAPTVNVQDFDGSCKAWYEDLLSTPPSHEPQRAYVKNLRDGDVLNAAALLSFGAIGKGIAPAGSGVETTGHFAFVLRKAGGPLLSQTLDDGRTEAFLDLPRGDYEMELRLLDNAGQAPIKSQVLRFSVQRP